MRYNSPVSSEDIREDIGLDAVLKDLKRRFECISWLEGYVFLRAYENRFVNAELQEVVAPIVYMGNNEYYDARPNDNLPATIFFRVNGDESTEMSQTKNRPVRQVLSTRPLSLIFWCDLTRINPLYKGDYLYTEPIKEELVGVLLRASQHVQSIDYIVDEPIERVFDGYTLVANMLDREPGSASYIRSPRNDRKQYGKYPFAGIRIDFTVAYRLSC